jgi:1-aminocyclopropane-1-carboxylate deaminase/D-cysteine desulfhydrase-like pyridoxal-dependent ACC family enzyme
MSTPLRPRAVSLIASLPSLPLWSRPSPVEELTRLRVALGGGPRLLVKRDDLLPFGFGGNKVRKLALVAGEAMARGADTLITCGAVQSNHARATAAVAARLGLACVLVHNGSPPAKPTGNALLDDLYGAERHYVASREERAPAMEEIAAGLRHSGRRPHIIPLGASTPLGAAAYARAVDEMLQQGVRPDIIVHASSSGGTQAGLVSGCVWHGLEAQVIGVSADEPEQLLAASIRDLVDAVAERFASGMPPPDRSAVIVDSAFVGGGYGVPTDASVEAQRLFARTEAVLLDPVYTAKAGAALMDYVRAGRFASDQTVLFWHTGGVPGIFA